MYAPREAHGWGIAEEAEALMSGEDDVLYSEDAEIAQLLLDVGSRQLTRRQILRRGVTLGLSIPAINWLLAASEDASIDLPVADAWSDAATG
jgi:hypothetical protein